MRISERKILYRRKGKEGRGGRDYGLRIRLKRFRWEVWLNGANEILQKVEEKEGRAISDFGKTAKSQKVSRKGAKGRKRDYGLRITLKRFR